MLRNVGLLLCSLGLVCLLGEGVLRLWSGNPLNRYDRFPQGLFCEPHALFGWSGRPRCIGVWPLAGPDMEVMEVRMNGQGFWDGPHALEKPPGIRRVLFLGDSFTIGFGVQARSRFADRVQAGLGQGYESMNMGMWGFSTGQEVLVLTELGLAYDPDVVVLALFLDDLYCSRLFSVNDGLYQKPKYALSDGNMLELQNVPVPNNHGPSRFWNFLVTRFSDLRNRMEVGEEAWRLGWVSVFDKAYVNDNGLTLSLLLLGRIQDLCSKEDVDLLVVIIPYKGQLQEFHIEGQGGSWSGIPSERLDLGLPQKVVKAYCQKRGIRCLDLLPIMERQPEPEGLFFKEDLHWTRRGHQVAADAILAELEHTGEAATGRHGRPRADVTLSGTVP